MNTTTQLERMLIEAFQLAEDSRQKAGLRPRSTAKLIREKNGKRVYQGPTTFKMTLWLRPWYYTDLMRSKIAEGFKGSLTKYLYSIIERTVERTAYRPTKDATTKAPIKHRHRRNGKHHQLQVVA